MTIPNLVPYIIAFFAGVGVCIAVQLVLLPFLKQEVNVVITGTADELQALADALRNHLLLARQKRIAARKAMRKIAKR